MKRVVEGLCFNRGWGAEQPRFAARLTQYRRADLVGFGDDDVWVAFNNGNDSFGPAQPAHLNNLCYNQGWRVESHPRFVADLTRKGQADLVGFGDEYVWVALNDGKGGFLPAHAALNNLCYKQGWRVESHPRFLADVTGNGCPDIVGFGDDGVWVALNDGKGGFGPAKFMLNDFGLHSLTGIDHLFVLILENRSFDHLLGFSGITGTDAVTGEPTTINGLTGSESNLLDGKNFTVVEGAHDTMPVDPGHGFRQTLVQLVGPGADDAWVPKESYPAPNNSGFIAQYGDELAEHDPGSDPSEIMRCLGPDQAQPTDDQFTTHIPVLHALAKEFAVCDAWFSSMPGPTFPNRMFAHAASSGGLDDNASGSDLAGWELAPGGGYSFQHGTIFDALNRAGLGFRLYGTRESQFSVDAERPFPMVASLKGISINSILDLQTDAQPPYPGYNRLVQDLPNKDFASVRYVHIEPSYGWFDSFKYGTSQHPLGSVRAGDNFLKMIYEAIRNSPVWESSLLIITWDEHGGFYDHVPPPSAVPPGDSSLVELAGLTLADHNKNGFQFDRLGVRGPAIVISPWIPKNLVDHRIYDHASIPASIELLYGLAPLTDRDRYANSVTTLLTLMAPRTDAPTTVGPRFGIEPAPPIPVAPPRPAALIDDPDTVPFLAILTAQDSQLSTPEERAAIPARIREIKTQADAWAYMKEVEQKIAARRGGPTMAEAPKKPISG